MRLFAHVHASITEFKGQRNIQIISKYRGLIRFSITIGVLQNHEFIIGFIARVHVRVGGRTTHPHPAARIPAHLDRAGDLRELLLTGKQVHLKARINLEGLEFISRAHPLIGPTTGGGLGQGRHVGIVNLCRNLFVLSQIPNTPIPVLHHDVEVAHGGQKIQIAVTAVATAGVIEGVYRAVPPKELLVLLHHRRL